MSRQIITVRLRRGRAVRADIERVPNYFQIACRRIEAAQMQGRLIE